MTLAKAQEVAMQLSVHERAQLLDWLWETVQGPATAQLTDNWGAESEQRIDAVDRGDLPTVDGPQAVQQLRDAIKE